MSSFFEGMPACHLEIYEVTVGASSLTGTSENTKVPLTIQPQVGWRYSLDSSTRVKCLLPADRPSVAPVAFATYDPQAPVARQILLYEFLFLLRALICAGRTRTAG